MAGWGAIVFTFLSFFNYVPAPKLFEGIGILCLVLAAFLVWRNEHKKIPPAEHPAIKSARDASLRVDLAGLSEEEKTTLKLLVMDGESPPRPAILSIANRTTLVVCDAGVWRVNATFRLRLEAWANEQFSGRQ